MFVCLLRLFWNSYESLFVFRAALPSLPLLILLQLEPRIL